MLININKNREIINEYTEDKNVWSTKIVNSIPEDVNEYVYKYIAGRLVRENLIDKNYKNQQTINAEQKATNEVQDEINVDFDYRLTMLELGL